MDAELLADQFEATAEWRRALAFKFPRDSERNLEAAKELERLAGELRRIEPSNVVELDVVDPCVSIEVEQELIREIGFAASYDSASDFLKALRESRST